MNIVYEPRPRYEVQKGELVADVLRGGDRKIIDWETGLLTDNLEDARRHADMLVSLGYRARVIDTAA